MSRPVILCVDDEKDVLDTLFRMLSEFKADYDIELAESGEEALEIFDDCCEDFIEVPLIIADFLMPGMRGDDLLIRLHKKHPGMTKILLTGQATLEGVKNVYENANLYRYISKPWDKQDLLITIREALKSYYNEKKLVKAEKKYKRIFENAAEGIFQTTLDGRILVANPALAACLGYESPEEMKTLLTNVQDAYVRPADRTRFIELLKDKQSTVNFETKFLKKDKSIVWVDICAGPVYNNKGDFETIEGFMLDITEKKTAQDELLEYQKHLEDLVEIRTEEIEEKNRKIVKINEELKKLSITDKLTGLFNRNKLDEVLEHEHYRASRYGSRYSLIMIDIDFFKSVNDTFGHLTGDTVLVEISAILKDSIRKVDTVGRWGGEEFIIVCPETSLEGAVAIAEKIREKVAGKVLKVVEHKTVSLGAASYKKGETLDDIIKRADDSLYRAKKNGRNRVEYSE